MSSAAAQHRATAAPPTNTATRAPAWRTSVSRAPPPVTATRGGTPSPATTPAPPRPSPTPARPRSTAPAAPAWRIAAPRASSTARGGHGRRLPVLRVRRRRRGLRAVQDRRVLRHGRVQARHLPAGGDLLQGRHRRSPLHLQRGGLRRGPGRHLRGERVLPRRRLPGGRVHPEH